VSRIVIALLVFVSSAAFAGDPITRLTQRLDAGRAKLEFLPGGLGYLPSLLQELDLPIDSQVLVFARNSFQAPKISPRTPRAIYFNDSVSVGFVPGGEFLEIAALDPVKGVAMYTLSTAQSTKPRFVPRDVECAGCHGYSGDVTLTVTSVFPKPDGDPFLPVGGSQPFTIDHRTPLAQRWGGWYVSGTLGGQHHMGNAVAPDPNHPLELRSLTVKMDADRYLAPTSDVAALMTLEHQTRMINLITRVSRIYRAQSKDAAAIDELVAYMLFAGEARLTAPVKGASTFTESFAGRGPRDSQGRSLRDFDLKSRMFRYPLSYMIYSDSFDALPAAARDLIYRRLYGVLSGKDTSPEFARLSQEDRRAVFEILRETKPDLPAYWRN
jgi:hypothetical protein